MFHRLSVRGVGARSERRPSRVKRRQSANDRYAEDYGANLADHIRGTPRFNVEERPSKQEEHPCTDPKHDQPELMTVASRSTCHAPRCWRRGISLGVKPPRVSHLVPVDYYQNRIRGVLRVRQPFPLNPELKGLTEVRVIISIVLTLRTVACGKIGTRRVRGRRLGGHPAITTVSL